MILRSAILFVCMAACSAPALMGDLAEAERHEHNGRNDDALAAYKRAQVNCKKIRKPRRRADTCRGAHMGHAELLERMGKKREAAAAYEAIAAELPADKVAISRAYYRAGKIHLELGDDERGYVLLWKTITEQPDEAHAADALKRILRDARKRGAIRHLYGELQKLAKPLRGTGVVDNIHYTLAMLAEQMQAPSRALAHYDELGKPEYRLSGLYDDALWHAARLSRAAGDGAGAAKRLRKLLATREVARGVGSYFSVWLDNAQLELGRVLRDDLRDYEAAVSAFKRLAKHYPASILKDDATFEIALTYQRMDRAERACQALAKLKKTWPESRYELSKAPALRRQLGCRG